MLKNGIGKPLIAASENRGPLRIFELKTEKSCIPVQPMDISALVQYKNGKVQKRETYYGSSFLSQSGRYLLIDKNVSSVKIKDNHGNEHSLNLNNK
jgi:hypothetical protein